MRTAVVCGYVLRPAERRVSISAGKNTIRGVFDGSAPAHPLAQQFPAPPWPVRSVRHSLQATRAPQATAMDTARRCCIHRGMGGLCRIIAFRGMASRGGAAYSAASSASTAPRRWR